MPPPPVLSLGCCVRLCGLTGRGKFLEAGPWWSIFAICLHSYSLFPDHLRCFSATRSCHPPKLCIKYTFLPYSFSYPMFWYRNKKIN